MSTEIFQISIPTDDDGYILLQCEHCGEFFKLTAHDCDNDEILHVVCPGCGLESQSYITQDVLDLALAMVKNYAMDTIYDAFKDLERSSRKNSMVKFKAGKRPEHEPENPIHSGIQALQEIHFPCCHHSAKIRPLLKMTGCYCPCCGVKNFDFK